MRRGCKLAEISNIEEFALHACIADYAARDKETQNGN